MKKRWTIGVVPGGAFTAAIADQAQEGDATFKACMSADINHAQMGDCVVAYLKREEAALSVAWKRAYSLMNTKEAKNALLAEQRAWITFKKVLRYLRRGELRHQESGAPLDPGDTIPVTLPRQ